MEPDRKATVAFTVESSKSKLGIEFTEKEV